MTILQTLQEMQVKWASKCGYKLSIDEEMSELHITSIYNIISRTYLEYLWYYDIRHYIDFHKKAIIIRKEEYERII